MRFEILRLDEHHDGGRRAPLIADADTVRAMLVAAETNGQRLYIKPVRTPAAAAAAGTV